MKILPTQFDGESIRREYEEETETWWFSVIDVVQVLTQQPDYQTARKYWNKLKERLVKEGSQLVTHCHQLKMLAADGKQRPTDAATAETLLRLVQSVPSPKAEPITGEALARFEIPLPPLPELSRGVAKFEDLSAETQRLESIYQQKVAALNELKKSLLQQAFSGAL